MLIKNNFCQAIAGLKDSALHLALFGMKASLQITPAITLLIGESMVVSSMLLEYDIECDTNISIAVSINIDQLRINAMKVNRWL